MRPEEVRLARCARAERQDSDRVGARRLADDEAEAVEPRLAELQVEAPARHDVRHEVDDQGEEVHAHFAMTFARAVVETIPDGRKRRAITKSAKATTYLRSGAMYPAAISLTTETIPAPSTAPNGEPTPPTIAPAITRRSCVEPVNEFKLPMSSTSSTPASPQNAPEMSHDRSSTRSTGTPEDRASDSFPAVARIARPNWVNRRKAPS